MLNSEVEEGEKVGRCYDMPQAQEATETLRGASER